jgi:ABC-type sugar transport system ATPase subunit
MVSRRPTSPAFASGEVLHGVDFTLRTGEIHAIVGHNGAGKSTLIKIIAGLYPDAEGDIAIRGAPVHLRSPREAAANAIAIIYQDFALVPDLSVAANIALGREPRTVRGCSSPMEKCERSRRAKPPSSASTFLSICRSGISVSPASR